MKGIVLIAMLAACSSGGERREISNMTEQQPAELEKRLVAAGYGGLFLSGDRTAHDAIWESGNNQRALQALIVDSTVSAQGKFLAAELLRTHGASLPPDASETLADVYAQALSSTSDKAGNPWRLNGNVWGFVQHADDPGTLGARFLELGHAARRPLLKLLDDDGPVFFEGSREAMTGNRLELQVRDFAAYYLGKIEKIAVPLGADRAARNAEIDKLRQAVNARL